MITIDDKTYRNLQEQVGFNTQVINKLIKNTFLNIKGLVNTIGELPTIDIADGTFYLVGITKPYQLYIYFENKWINLGDFKVEAIDGKNGEQGLPGHTPVITIGNNLNWFIDGVDTGVTAKGQNGISIRGPQGIRGDKGERGPQGDPGINSFQFTVIDTLNSTDDLPSPLGTPRNYAYLVNDDLYIIVGDNSNLMWKNVGQLGGTIIQNYTVGNPEGQPSTALTKLQIDNTIFSVVSKDSDLFNSNQLAAINSGITSDSVRKIQNNTDSINIINQNVNELSSTVESNKNDINSKVDELATATESALTQYNQMINSKQPLLVSGTNIKTINGNSILGSGNLNLLKDQKLDVSVECDHEYEITGKTGHEYGVAIEDSQMLLKKIQGQTRRYSLNLLSNSDLVSHVNVNDDNSYTININSGGKKYLIQSNKLKLNGNYTVALILYEKPTTSTSLSLYKNASEISGFSNINGYELNTIYTKNITFNNEYLNIQFWATTYPQTLKLKIWIVEGTYTDATMPAFQPYDDTLVNSKCNLISTGRNLINPNNYVDGITFNNQSEIKIFNYGNTGIYYQYLPAGTYSFNSQSSDIILSCGYTQEIPAVGVKCKGLVIGSSNGTVELPIDAYLCITNTNATLENINKLKQGIIVNYGTSSLEYEPYKQDIIQVNTKLGEYDYIDNVSHLVIRQTSDIITLDGSVDEEYVYNADSGYISYDTKIKLANDGVSNKLTYDYTSITNNFGTFWVSTDTRIIFGVKNSTIDSVEEWRTYLQNNPIQVVAKLATPTTTQISLPAGYAVYTGGLQQQVINGKYLPYVLYKLYSVSVPSQMLANIEIDRAQQDVIDWNFQRISERIDRTVQGINAQIAQINKRLSQLEG